MATTASNSLIRPLNELRLEINAEHTLAEGAAVTALGHAKRTGELLVEAKNQIPHGDWLQWLAANCEVSPRQAQRYIKVATNWERISKNDAASYLTIDNAISKPKPDDKDEWIKRLNDLPIGRLLVRFFEFGYAVVFRSKDHPEYFHFNAYILELELESGEAQESKRPMLPFFIASLLSDTGWQSSTFCEVEDDGNKELGNEMIRNPERKFARRDPLFYQRLGGDL